MEQATELEYLKFFFQYADFGPADSDVRYYMNELFTKKTGKSLPSGVRVRINRLSSVSRSESTPKLIQTETPGVFRVDALPPLVERAEECAMAIGAIALQKRTYQMRHAMSVLIANFVRRELAEAAKLADNPYSDEVSTIGEESPLDVGAKISSAIKLRML